MSMPAEVKVNLTFALIGGAGFGLWMWSGGAFIFATVFLLYLGDIAIGAQK